MACITLKNGTTLCFASEDFFCPHCNKHYNEDNEIYVKRINKNKRGYTKITCECKGKFYLTQGYNELITFL